VATLLLWNAKGDILKMTISEMTLKFMHIKLKSSEVIW